MIKIYSAISIILFVIIILFFIFYKSKKDNYVQFLPPFTSSEAIFYKKMIITPLVAVKAEYKQYSNDKIKLPEIFIYNPLYLSPVRKQGRCGACWAFVITSMLSDDVTIRIGNFGKSLDAQQLLSCYNNGDLGCGGASPEDVLKWMEKVNFKLRISDEYYGKRTKCIQTESGISVAKGSIKSLC